MSNSVDYFIGDELEPLELWWYANGTLVDFSVTHTYVVTVATTTNPETVVFTKTSDVTGSARTGTQTAGTPNVSIAWGTSGELNNITETGRYICQVVATRSSDDKQRTARIMLNMLARV